MGQGEVDGTVCECCVTIIMFIVVTVTET